MKLNPINLALKYLSYRDRTAHEIRKYLSSKNVSKSDIADCLDYLAECGLIDDESYCGRYIIYSMEKGRGPLRIRKELREKGISPETIDIYIEEHFAEGGELKAAWDYTNRLLDSGFENRSGGHNNNNTLTDKEIARLGRRLAGRGYSGGVIYEVLGKLRR
ncbi:MAG TPA: regulatory protein RecX [Anaerovoracaceae bacterium]|nr:regulatory protein RecX [Anaerovoracaceae bacterium]